MITPDSPLTDPMRRLLARLGESQDGSCVALFQDAISVADGLERRGLVTTEPLHSSRTGAVVGLRLRLTEAGRARLAEVAPKGEPNRIARSRRDGRVGRDALEESSLSVDAVRTKEGL